MTRLEQTILREIAALPETRRADVLAFVRFLKLSIPSEQKESEEGFDKALKRRKHPNQAIVVIARNMLVTIP